MKTILAALSALLLIGCASTWTVKPGSDPVVVIAEQTASEALNVLDDFISYVDRNRAIAGKDLLAARDLAATSGPVYLRELRRATKEYKANRTEPNKSALQAKVDALRGLLEVVREKYTKQ